MTRRLFTILLCSCFINGCTTVQTLTVDTEFMFCKAGIGGDYRILVPADPQELPQLALFSVGGPYDKEHVLCVVSGDHAILDLGKGKGL